MCFLRRTKPCISLNVGVLLSLAKALRGLCRDNMAAKRQVSRLKCCVTKWKPCQAMTNSDQESSVSTYLHASGILVPDLLRPRWHLLYHCSHLACSFLAAFNLQGTCACRSLGLTRAVSLDDSQVKTAIFLCKLFCKLF